MKKFRPLSRIFFFVCLDVNFFVFLLLHCNHTEPKDEKGENDIHLPKSNLGHEPRPQSMEVAVVAGTGSSRSAGAGIEYLRCEYAGYGCKKRV